ncbi:MAG: hypothetical protein AB7S55_09320 [Thiomonas sp.]
MNKPAQEKCFCDPMHRQPFGILSDARSDPKENLQIKKEIYAQTQNWARHNEMLIVATNTILLGAVAGIYSSHFKNFSLAGFDFYVFLLTLPILGLIITIHLNREYINAIDRIIKYETYFGLHASCSEIQKISNNDCRWGASFIPNYLHNHRRFSASTITFAAIHGILLVTFISLAWYAHMHHTKPDPAQCNPSMSSCRSPA